MTTSHNILTITLLFLFFQASQVLGQDKKCTCACENGGDNVNHAKENSTRNVGDVATGSITGEPIDKGNGDINGQHTGDQGQVNNNHQGSQGSNNSQESNNSQGSNNSHVNNNSQGSQRNNNQESNNSQGSNNNQGNNNSQGSHNSQGSNNNSQESNNSHGSSDSQESNTSQGSNNSQESNNNQRNDNSQGNNNNQESNNHQWSNNSQGSSNSQESSNNQRNNNSQGSSNNSQGSNNNHDKGNNNGQQPINQGQENNGGQQTSNGDSEKMIAAEFIKWITFISGLSHSLFPKANNKFTISRTITVDTKASAGGFTSIQAAIDSVPVVNLARIVININAGVYREKLLISPLRSFITLQGSGADNTVIEWGPDGSHQFGAFTSATVAVNAPYFEAKNITFKNTNSEAEGGHGVALRISADTASFTGCKFLGIGNTLYDHIGRHYYKECSIEGGADFIFGQALSMFEECKLSAMAEAAARFTTHTGASLMDNAGMSFQNCRLSGAALAYLGKAWGTFSRVIIANSYLDHVQLPRGLDVSLGFKKQLNVYFGLHNCHGPGADFVIKSSWSMQLSFQQAAPFTSLSFIDGNEWIQK